MMMSVHSEFFAHGILFGAGLAAVPLAEGMIEHLDLDLVVGRMAGPVGTGTGFFHPIMVAK
jgi:hypothetical protein